MRRNIVTPCANGGRLGKDSIRFQYCSVTNIIQYRITRNMADDRKKGISFSFSKKVTTRKNILNSDDARTKEEETDYINAAEGKGLIR